VRLPVIPRKAILGGSEEGLHTLNELTMGHLTANMSPEHFDGVQPGTVWGKIAQAQPSGGTSYHGLDGRVLMGGRMISGHIDRLLGMFLEQGLEEFGHLLAPLMASAEDHRFPGMGVDGAKAIVFGRWSWSRNQHLLACRAPHGPEGWQPCEVVLVCIVADLLRGQVITRLFERLFLT
jgi:hypothetical protein